MKKKKTVFKMKKSFIRTVVDILVLTILLIICGLADHMYQNESDWMRTLGHNYDFSGENEKVHNLYIGSFCFPEDEGRNLSDFQGNKNNCRLVNKKQSLYDSYYLLQKADRRYPLSHIYLGLDCPSIMQKESVTPGNKRSLESEMLYLQKIIAYCNKRELELTIYSYDADTEEEDSTNIYMQYICEITAEYGVECYWASSPSR